MSSSANTNKYYKNENKNYYNYNAISVCFTV